MYTVVFAPLPFVPAWWQQGAIDWQDYMDPLHKRARIADGLKLGGGLTGKSRQDVVALLGEPVETDQFPNYDLAYPLGRSRKLMGIDSEWLVIRLGSDARAEEVAVLED